MFYISNSAEKGLRNSSIYAPLFFLSSELNIYYLNLDNGSATRISADEEQGGAHCLPHGSAARSALVEPPLSRGEGRHRGRRRRQPQGGLGQTG